jgi:NADH-quinone oxidoreductase subunit K
MSLELMLLGVNTNFVAFAYWQHNHTGQIMVFFVIATAAAEAALGLAIAVLLYRNQQSLDVDKLNTLQG